MPHNRTLEGFPSYMRGIHRGSSECPRQSKVRGDCGVWREAIWIDVDAGWGPRAARPWLCSVRTADYDAVAGVDRAGEVESDEYGHFSGAATKHPLNRARTCPLTRQACGLDIFVSVWQHLGRSMSEIRGQFSLTRAACMRRRGLKEPVVIIWPSLQNQNRRHCMKRLCAKAGRAFTLIELLVAVAILAQNMLLRWHCENHR